MCGRCEGREGHVQPERHCTVCVVLQPQAGMQRDDLGAANQDDVYDDGHTVVLCWRPHDVPVFADHAHSDILQQEWATQAMCLAKNESAGRHVWHKEQDIGSRQVYSCSSKLIFRVARFVKLSLLLECMRHLLSFPPQEANDCLERAYQNSQIFSCLCILLLLGRGI